MIFNKTSKQLLALGGKFLFFLPAVMLSCQIQAAETQNGKMTQMKVKVVRDDKNGPPVKGVMVLSKAAHDALSPEDGVVTLEFPKNKPGDKVTIEIVSKEFAIVNDFEMKPTYPAKTMQVILLLLSVGRIIFFSTGENTFVK